MQGKELRDIEWAPPKERPPVVSASDQIPQTYGSWQWAKGGGRGQIGGSAFTMQEEGTWRCPAGATLWESRMAAGKCLYAAGGFPCFSRGLPGLPPA
jgi:hypothetical protein